MIDAMCSECRHLRAEPLSRRPGWKCFMDPAEETEHDPTDEACEKFRRKRTVMLVRQEIPVPVRPTGQVTRTKDGAPVGIEVVPDAPWWHTRTTWALASSLIWEDGEPVLADELESICRWESEIGAAVAMMAMNFPRVSLGVMGRVAEAAADAVRHLEFPMSASDLIEVAMEHSVVGDLLSGVSAISVAERLAKSGRLAKWGIAGFVEGER